MDPGGVHQLLHVLVPLKVGLTDVLGQVEKQLSAQHLHMWFDDCQKYLYNHLIAVHVGHILHLWLSKFMVSWIIRKL